MRNRTRSNSSYWGPFVFPIYCLCGKGGLGVGSFFFFFLKTKAGALPCHIREERMQSVTRLILHGTKKLKALGEPNIELRYNGGTTCPEP